MTEIAGPPIRVRAVRGRIVDPFRGLVDDGAQRLASRPTESQPFDDVMAAVGAVAGTTLERAGRRFMLKRGTETLKVSFASAGKRVSLDDLALAGDGGLALAVMHALMPLFGAVEVEIGRYGDLVDGHEPLDTICKRYDAWFIDDSLRVAERMQARDAAARVAAAQPPPPVRPRRLAGARFPLAVAGVLMLLVLITFMSERGSPHAYHRHAIGESCTQHLQCEADKCLQHDRSATEGVCTKSCTSDADCPASMRCGDVVDEGFIGIDTRESACIPRPWAP